MTIPGGRDAVGRVYVEVVASGVALEKSIHDAVRNADGHFQSAGRESGEKWGKAVADGIESGDSLDDVLLKQLSAKKAQATGVRFGKGLEDGLRKSFGAKGAKGIVKNLNKQLRANQKSVLNNMTGAFDRAVEETAKANARVLDERMKANAAAQAVEAKLAEEQRKKNLDKMLKGLKQQVTALKDFQAEATRITVMQEELRRRSMEEILKQTIKDRKKREEERLAVISDSYARLTAQSKGFFATIEKENARVAKAQKDQIKALKSYEKNFLEASDAIEAIRFRQAKAEETYATNIGATIRRETRDQKRAVKELEAAWSTYGKNLLAADDFTKRINSNIAVRKLHDIEAALAKFNKEKKNSGIGNPFSRSRWLRPIGAIISGISQIPKVLGKVAESAVSTASDIAKAFSPAQGGGLAKGFLELGTKIGGAFLNIAALGATVAAVFAAIIFIAGPLVAALANIAVGAIALASSIGLGIIGALGAALPIVAALAPLAGVLAIAIGANSKAFKDASQPIVDWYDAIKKPISDNVLETYKQFVEDLGPLLGAIKPLLDRTADAVKTGFGKIGANLKDPAFLASIDALSNEKTGLPAITSTMLAAVGNFASGLTGLLVPLLGPAKNLADNIENITKRFSDFTNSTTGQDTLKDWFDKAWEAATKVAGVIGAISGAIGSLLSNDKNTGTGNGFLDSITSSFERLSDWIDGGGLDKALERSKAFFHDLGGAVDTIGRIFDALNSDKAQENLSAFLNLIAGFDGSKINSFVGNMEKIGSAISFLVEWLFKLVPSLGILKTLFDILSGDWGGAASSLLGALSLVGGALMAFWEPLNKAWDVAWGAFKGAAEAVGTWITGTLLPTLKGLPGTIIGALGEFGPKLTLWFGKALLGVTVFLLKFLATEWLPFWITLPFRTLAVLFKFSGMLIEWADKAFTKVRDWIFNWVTGTLIPFLGKLPLMMLGALVALGGLLVGWGAAAFTAVYNWIAPWVTNTLIPWFKALPGVLLNALVEFGGKLQEWISTAWTNVKTWVTDWVTNTLIPWFKDLPGNLRDALEDLGPKLKEWISEAWTGVKDWLTDWVPNTLLPWLAGLPQMIIDAIGDLGAKLTTWVVEAFGAMWTGLKNWWNETFIPWIKGIPQSILDNIPDWAKDLTKKFVDPMKEAYEAAKGWADKLKHLFTGEASAEDVLGNLPPEAFGEPRMAGGWIDRPSLYKGHPVGEKWLKEIVIPMELPLNQVNPEVREMARAARAVANGTQTKGNIVQGPTYNYDVDVSAPQSDPAAAAAHWLAFMPGTRV